jgi:hypothetical protein
MTARLLRPLAAIVLLAAAAGAALYLWSDRAPAIEAWSDAGRPPAIHPDYAGIVIPANIAPLNFVIAEPAARYVVRIHAPRGQMLEIAGRSPRIIIPPGPWHELLAANRGEPLEIDVFAGDDAGAWRRFQPIANHIAAEDIDNHLVYRKIKPLYNWYGPIGIYQRDLETYKEKPLFRNTLLAGRNGCPNCHTFLANRPETMILHIRGPSGGTLFLRDGQLQKVDTRTKHSPSAAAFASWHPSGKLLAFSTNLVQQFFHTARAEVRDAYDLNSDIMLYLVDS